MNINNISNIVDEFDSRSTEVKRLITKILVVISDGRIPEKNDMDAFAASMEELESKYNIIYNKAQSILTEDEMPEKDSSIQKYFEAIEKSKVRGKILAAQNTLSQFINIKSMMDNLVDLILPYQEKAKTVLNRFEQENLQNTNKLIEAAEKPQMFLDALKADRNTKEGLEKVNRLYDYYDPLIVAGLASGNYFLGSSKEGKLESKKQKDNSADKDADTDPTSIIKDDFLKKKRNRSKYKMEKQMISRIKLLIKKIYH